MTFDAVAPFYDRLAHLVFGPTLEQAQLSLFDQLPVGGKWLVLGGGTGWLLEQVMNRCQPTHIVFLEASEKMLELARQRLKSHPNYVQIEFRQGTEQLLSPTEKFDVVLTPFVLDLFTTQHLEIQMIPRLLDALKPGGYWLITDFVPTKILWQQLLVKTMQFFFRISAALPIHRLPDWMPLLLKRMVLETTQSAFHGLIRSCLFRPLPGTS